MYMPKAQHIKVRQPAAAPRGSAVGFCPIPYPFRIEHHRQIQDQKLKIIIRKARKDIIKPGKHLQNGCNYHEIEQLCKILSGETAQHDSGNNECHNYQKAAAHAGINHKVRFIVIEITDKRDDLISEYEYQSRTNRIKYEFFVFSRLLAIQYAGRNINAGTWTHPANAVQIKNFFGFSSIMPIKANINKPIANACLIALNPNT